MISHSMINDCLDFHVVKKCENISKGRLEFNFKLSVEFLFVFSVLNVRRKQTVYKL